ncbi:hypothetical protein BN1356_02439 [Streptococcus varani]|uniref:Uncharacterized protein n=1 Tax=Streptococcus varani TaxID=1608583 RepID=A0A0E4H5I4_9STRE|nr:hypothetical protein [Streptococcus varani]CQR26095.1 hypothetical protein BN1356_02439 [Streptococcus varani]
MIKFEDAKATIDKYDGSLSKMFNEGTIRENKLVLKWVAEEANRKQRKLVGLDK